MGSTDEDAGVHRTTCQSVDGDFEWIRLSHPDPAVLQKVAAEISMPDLYAEDALNLNERAKLEVNGESAFVILKPVQIESKTGGLNFSQWAIYITPGYLLSVTIGGEELMDEVRQGLGEGTPDDVNLHGPQAILHRCADVMADEYTLVLNHLHSEALSVETDVFARMEKASDWNPRDQTQRIYQLKRRVSAFRQVVVPLAYAVHRLTVRTDPGSRGQGRRAELTPYFQDVYDHILQTSDSLESIDKLLSDVLQADLALISMQQSELAIRQNEVAEDQNDVARQISAWVAIGGIPTVIAGIFGMNFVNMPPLKAEYGFYVMLIGTAVICMILYIAFRRQKWL